ncbi:MAG: hypothetical protein JWO95_3020 [Verrucomicrobiales bacterium]|nr:hypothetical protein [Verrucomicrobiales bacterium]
MSNEHKGLYPIIRRVRRPLIPTDAGTAAPAVVPVKPAEPTQTQPKALKRETKTDAAPTQANE